MAAKDTITKDYMNDAEIFADAFNYLIYDGREVIAPGRLHKMDTAEIGLPYGEGSASAPVQKYRDSLKYLTAMEDGTAAYLLLGIENQSEVHYAMAVRNMVYDALQYAAQVEKAAKSHRKAVKDRRVAKEEGKKEASEKRDEDIGDPGVRPSGGEYLSGFYKEDCLIPVITLVVLFNPESWDGPMSIHDMLSVKDPEILSYVPDYRINLIAPGEMEADSMDKFKTSLREVMLYIKYSNDKERLMKLLETDRRFQSMERRVAEVINVVTNSTLKFDEKEERVNMCQAVKEIRLEGRIEGRTEGEEKLGKLISLLIAAGRTAEAQRAAVDKGVREALYKEYKIV